MHEQPPIPENEDHLFLNYIRGWGDSITLAHTFNLTIDQFIEWANSDEIRTRVNAAARSAAHRSKAILAASQLDIINTLLRIALSPPPQTDDPKVIATAQETARKAASLLFRAAQKQSLEDEPNTPDDPQDDDPDDDPETDPDGDSDIGPDNSLGIRSNDTRQDDTTLPNPKGAIPGATSRRAAAQMCDWNLDIANSQPNAQSDMPAPDSKLPSLARATVKSRDGAACSSGSDAIDDKALKGQSLHTSATTARSGALGIESQPPRVAPCPTHAIDDRPSRPEKTHSLALVAPFHIGPRSTSSERPQLLALARASGSCHGWSADIVGTEPVEGCADQRRPGGPHEAHAVATNNLPTITHPQSSQSQIPFAFNIPPPLKSTRRKLRGISALSLLQMCA